jgi:hypothetical protein
MTKTTYEYLYQKTQQKKQFCIDQGYNYVEMWECQWNQIKKQKDLTLEQLLNIEHNKDTIDPNIITSIKFNYSKST